MNKEFRIVHEGILPGTPEQAWQAITRGTAGWLWPLEYEEREGGSGPFEGVVSEWDPPKRLVTRAEGPEGWFNQLEYTLEPRPDGKAWLHYVHAGMLDEDWDNQYDQAKKHTTFYMATLAEYIEHFLGRPAVQVSNEEPRTSGAKDALDKVAAKIRLAEGDGRGAAVVLDVPGIGQQSGVIDFRDANFIGVRTQDALVRIFGRNAWGGVVGYSIHDFSGKRTAEELTSSWDAWIEAVYA